MKKIVLLILLLTPFIVMSQALELPYSVKVVNPYPTDGYYYNIARTTYINTAQVLSQVGVGVRYIGQTFNVSGVEYWFNPTTANGDLVVKIPSGSGGTVTSVNASVPSIFSITGNPITTSGTLAMTYSGTALPVANGGTGTSTPALVAGSNISITGAWPNQTINAPAQNTILAQYPSNVNNSLRGFTQIMKLADGRYLGFVIQFGPTPGDPDAADIFGTYSSDKGRTWGTLFMIKNEFGLGSGISSQCPSVHKKYIAGRQYLV